MDKKKKYLILGGSSYVGKHLFAKLGAGRAVATYSSHPVEGMRHFDAVTMKLSDVITNPADFSCAVILYADPNPDTCFADPAKSHRLNVESTQTVIDQLVDWGIKPIFTSTEFVFGGHKGGYVEADPPDPILVYGQQKVLVETYIQAHCKEYLTVRLAKVFGITPGDGTLFTNWVKRIRAGGVISCAADQTFSPVYVGDVVDAIAHLVVSDCNGIYHLGGPEPYSRMALLQKLISRIQEHAAVSVEVEPCSIHDFDLPEKRPLDVSINSDKLAQTGYHMKSVDYYIEQVVNNEEWL